MTAAKPCCIKLCGDYDDSGDLYPMCAYHRNLFMPEAARADTVKALEAVETRIRHRLNDEVNEHYHQGRKTYQSFLDAGKTWEIFNQEFAAALSVCPYCRGYPTPMQSEANKESSCTCPKPCGAGGCPKAALSDDAKRESEK